MIDTTITELYSKSISDLDILQRQLQDEKIDFEVIVFEASQDIPSDLDVLDILLSMTFGLIAALITTRPAMKSQA